MSVTPASHGAALWGNLRSELVTLRRARGRWLAILLLALGGAAAAMATLAGGAAAELGLGDDPLALGLSSGFALVPYGATLLGLSTVTADAPVTRIRFAWVPTRWPVVCAKAAAAVVAALIMSVTALAASYVGTALVAGHAPDITPGAAGVAGGGVLGSALLALLGVGVGASLRRALDGYVAIVGLLLVLPIASGSLAAGAPFLALLARWLPVAAANALFDPLGSPSVTPAWVLACWSVAAMLLGFVLTQRRDVG